MPTTATIADDDDDDDSYYLIINKYAFIVCIARVCITRREYYLWKKTFLSCRVDTLTQHALLNHIKIHVIQFIGHDILLNIDISNKLNHIIFILQKVYVGITFSGLVCLRLCLLKVSFRLFGWWGSSAFYLLFDTDTHTKVHILLQHKNSNTLPKEKMMSFA